jgi:hypothetical protein
VPDRQTGHADSCTAAQLYSCTAAQLYSITTGRRCASHFESQEQQRLAQSGCCILAGGFLFGVCCCGLRACVAGCVVCGGWVCDWDLLFGVYCSGLRACVAWIVFCIGRLTPEVQFITILRNVGNRTSYDAVSHLRRSETSL